MIENIRFRVECLGMHYNICATPQNNLLNNHYMPTHFDVVIDDINRGVINLEAEGWKSKLEMPDDMLQKIGELLVEYFNCDGNRDNYKFYD